MTLPKLFHDQRIFEMPAAKAAMLFAERRAEHAEILCQRFPDAGVATAVAGDHLLAAVEIIGVRQKAAECFADHVLRFGVAEIHFDLPFY